MTDETGSFFSVQALDKALAEIERLRKGIQHYVDDNFKLKYSRSDADAYFTDLLNPKDSKDD